MTRDLAKLSARHWPTRNKEFAVFLPVSREPGRATCRVMVGF